MSPEKPLVSVIIPCFNREQYLPVTIESCLDQAYPNIEIIVVDDGSTDKSFDVARKYEKVSPRVKAFVTAHSGQCAARNFGLGHAGGEFIKFLDSDDLLLPHSIEHQVKSVIFHKAEIAVSGSLGFKDGELEIARKELQSDEFSPAENAVVENIFDFIKRGKGSTGDFLFTKKIIREVSGFEPGLEATEEINLLLRMAVLFPETRVARHKTKLLLKRLGHDSQSGRPQNVKWGLFSLLSAAEKCLEAKPKNRELKKFIFNSLYTSMIYSYRSGFQKEAFSACSLWKKGRLGQPVLGPWYHDLLHRAVGFNTAERMLDIARKIIYRRKSLPLCTMLNSKSETRNPKQILNPKS